MSYEYWDKYYIGIDIGGMSAKGIMISSNGALVCDASVATGMQSGEALASSIATLVDNLIEKSGKTKSEIVGVGMGCPGLIDSRNGVVVYAANLGLENFPLAKAVQKEIKLPTKMVNDANAAALGEAKFGAGKMCADAVLVTLGTGVGTGVIIDGTLFEGFKSAGTEIGHMVIEEGGLPCTCGRRGCFEAYSSASALIKKTREAMQAHPESAMWKGYKLETVNGKTAFDYPDDPAATEVIDWYVKYLACGITNIANIFRPRIIMIGGGVSEQGERLLAPLRKLVNEQIFAGADYAPLEIAKATLGNAAGAYGAASLFM